MTFNPARDFDEEFQTSFDVQSHFVVSAVRVLLVEPSDNSPLSSYYSIPDLEVDGHCACYGHSGECTGEVIMS